MEVRLHIDDEYIQEVFDSAIDAAEYVRYVNILPNNHRFVRYDVNNDGSAQMVTHIGEVEMHDAFMKMLRAFPEHARNIWDMDYDAMDADIFLQFCLFGEVIIS